MHYQLNLKTECIDFQCRL